MKRGNKKQGQMSNRYHNILQWLWTKNGLLIFTHSLTDLGMTSKEGVN